LKEDLTMLPIRTILHPNDFSQSSTFAFGVAAALARDYGARIVVVHVAEPALAVALDGVMVSPPDIDWEALRQRLCYLCPSDAQVQVEHIVAEGSPPTDIVRLAQDYNADIIVMGTHGRTGLSRLVMGSVAEQVVRRAPCPVVTVKKPVRTVDEVTHPLGEPVVTSTSSAAGEAE
jgi:universal stress protein A